MWPKVSKMVNFDEHSVHRAASISAMPLGCPKKSRGASSAHRALAGRASRATDRAAVRMSISTASGCSFLVVVAVARRGTQVKAAAWIGQLAERVERKVIASVSSRARSTRTSR